VFNVVSVADAPEAVIVSRRYVTLEPNTPER
jgi:hypothetical protein